MPTNRERAKEIDDLLKTVEPRFRKAFETGIRSLRDSFSLAEIERALNSGDLAQAANLINEAIVATAFIQFNREIQAAVQAGGDLAARWARADRIVFDLSVTESNTARFISSYQADKIREITAQTQMNIGEIVRGGVNAGRNPRDIARTVRDSIGLTAKQEASVENYRQLLRQNKKEALRRALRDRRFDRSLLAAINEQRDLPKELEDKMVQRYRERFIRKRSQDIARTEAIRLVSTGNQHFWEQAVSDGVVEEKRLKRRWLPTQDGRVREAHSSISRLNPDGVGLNEPFKSSLGPIRYPGDPTASAGNVINCVIGDTVIDCAGLSFATRHLYNGDIVTIKLANGKKITVTPNHPILTKSGWVNAGKINKGDNVACGARRVNKFLSGFVGADTNNVVASAEKVFNLCDHAGVRMRAPISRFNFHGDIPAHNVDVVYVNCFLLNKINPALSKLVSQFSLAISNFNKAFFNCFSRISKPLLLRFGIVLSRINCGLYKFLSFLGSRSGVSNFPSFAYSSFFKAVPFKGFLNKILANIKGSCNFRHGNSRQVKFFNFRVEFFPAKTNRVNKPVFSEPIGEAIGVSAETFSDACERLPINIFLVDVVDVVHSSYSGYVYNFETRKNYYIGGGIVNHNCRCAVITRITTD